MAPSSFGVMGVPWVHLLAALLHRLRAEPRWERSPEMSRNGSKPHSEGR